MFVVIYNKKSQLFYGHLFTENYISGMDESKTRFYYCEKRKTAIDYMEKRFNAINSKLSKNKNVKNLLSHMSDDKHMCSIKYTYEYRDYVEEFCIIRMQKIINGNNGPALKVE